MAVDLPAAVEALFFGTGPLARIENPGCDATLQRMRGWARGSRVRVVAYGSIDAERRGAVERTLQQIGDVLGSAISTAYQTRDDLGQPEGSAEGEIAMFGVDAASAPTFCGTSPNCQVVRYNLGAYLTSRVIFSKPFSVPSDGIVSHELGHAFGLCHIDPARGGLDPSLSVMSSTIAGRLTALDLEAFRVVYGAGLSPGDSRQRFVSAGLFER